MTPRPRRRRAALAALLLAATAAAAGCATRPPEQAPAGDIEELFRTEVGAEPLGLARRADGDLLVVAAEGRALSLVDADTGAELKRLDLRDHGRLNRVVAAPEAVYVTASVAGRVLVIDPGLSGVEAAIPVGGFPQGMALHGDRLFVANTASGTVSVVDRGARAVVATVDVGERPQELAVDPERDRLIVLKTTTRSLRVLGLGDLEERAVWRNPELVRPIDLALTADGGVLVADAGAQALVLFGTGGEVARRLGLPGGVVTPTALALAPDGRRVAVADRGGSISLLDLLDPGGGAAAATVVAPDLRAVLFAPDGRLYATSFGGDALIALAADEG